MDVAIAARATDMRMSVEEMAECGIDERLGWADDHWLGCPGGKRPKVARTVSEELSLRDLEPVIADLVASGMIDLQDIRLYAPDELLDLACRHL